MGDLNSIEDVFEYLKGSTAFWVIAAVAGLLLLASFVRGGRR